MQILKLLPLCLVLWLTPAEAQHYQGDTIRLSGTLLCDELEQIDEILTAQTESWSGHMLMLRKWNRHQNEQGDASCYPLRGGQWIDVVLVKTVKSFKDMPFPGDKTFNVHITAVLWTNKNGEEFPGYVATDFVLTEGKRPLISPSALDEEA